MTSPSALPSPPRRPGRGLPALVVACSPLAACGDRCEESRVEVDEHDDAIGTSVAEAAASFGTVEVEALRVSGEDTTARLTIARAGGLIERVIGEWPPPGQNYECVARLVFPVELEVSTADGELAESYTTTASLYLGSSIYPEPPDQTSWQIATQHEIDLDEIGGSWSPAETSPSLEVIGGRLTLWWNGWGQGGFFTPQVRQLDFPKISPVSDIYRFGFSATNRSQWPPIPWDPDAK